MKVKLLLSALLFALALPTVYAQDHPPHMGVAIQNIEDNADKSVTIVHLVNVSGKEVTAFNISANQKLPDGKISPPSANSYDLLGGYLSSGKAFSPDSTYDAQVGHSDGTTLIVDVVIYADGTAQVQNQDSFEIHVPDCTLGT